MRLDAVKSRRKVNKKQLHTLCTLKVCVDQVKKGASCTIHSSLWPVGELEWVQLVLDRGTRVSVFNPGEGSHGRIHQWQSQLPKPRHPSAPGSPSVAWLTPVPFSPLATWTTPVPDCPLAANLTLVHMLWQSLFPELQWPPAPWVHLPHLNFDYNTFC